MQFREFGEWITCIANMHDPVRYVLLISPDEPTPLPEMIHEAGIEDRFSCEVLPSLMAGRMIVIAQKSGQDCTRSIVPLEEALAAAIRADLKGQLIEDAAERMLEDRPYILRFDNTDRPELPSATHPEGEGPDAETGGQKPE